MLNFRQILDKIDEGKNLLTEETKTGLVTLMEEKMKSIKEEAYAKAVEQANKKVEQLDESHAAKFEEVLSAMKNEYESKIKSLNEELEKMDEEHAKAARETFEKMDEDYAEQVRVLFEDVDDFCAKKLDEALEAQDSEHGQALQQVVEHFESKVITDKMAKVVDTFLESYLDEVKPADKIISEAKLDRLEQFYDKIKQLTFVNDDYVQTELSEAVTDATMQLKSKDDEIDKLMLEKAEISSRLNKVEADKLLAESIKDFTPSMKAYLEARFKDANRQEIEEKLNEAVEAFKLEEKSTREKLVLEAESKKKITAPVINEETANIKTNASTDNEPYKMDNYLSALNRLNEIRK